MTSTIDLIGRHAAACGTHIAVRQGDERTSYATLLRDAAAIATTLQTSGARVAALAVDNGYGWLAVDLAAQLSRTALVPLPGFFTREQIAHALADSGADTLISDARSPLLQTPGVAPVQNLSPRLVLARICGATPVDMPAATAKISYTSGTTGQPKGVCLTAAAMDAVAESLRAAVAELSIERHLCVLPLATLLENIAGVYAPLRAGAEVIAPSLVETGLAGATRFDVVTLLGTIRRYEPQSIILLPQMLAALVAALERGATRPASLRFIAVGGGRVSPALLARADALGLPVYEGYGLTECASVVALNSPYARRIGSVGKPLPHASVGIDDRGEIVVAGAAVAGYVGGGDVPQRIATGDLGRFDRDGYLYIDGRRKNVFITSFGRNVSPEWVEAEIAEQGAVAQVAVFGEARPWNVAVVVPMPGSSSGQAAIQAALDRANARLPDYARVSDWLLASEPFTAANGLLTPNGRNRRAAIWRRYGREIDALYDSKLGLTA